LTSMVLGYPLAFTPQFAPQLRFYVFKAQAHCPRPERFAPRPLFCE